MPHTMNLNAQDVYDKVFTVERNGYKPEEVDSYLDLIIEDYQTSEENVKVLSQALLNCEEKVKELEARLASAGAQSEQAHAADSVADQVSRLEDTVYANYQSARDLIDELMADASEEEKQALQEELGDNPTFEGMMDVLKTVMTAQKSSLQQIEALASEFFEELKPEMSEEDQQEMESVLENNPTSEELTGALEKMFTVSSEAAEAAPQLTLEERVERLERLILPAQQ